MKTMGRMSLGALVAMGIAVSACVAQMDNKFCRLHTLTGKLPTPLPTSLAQALSDIESNMSKAVDSVTGPPSLFAAIVTPEGIVWSHGTGVKDKKDGPQHTAPTSRTLYRLGSVSKLFTALQVIDAAEKKRIRLDDPLVKYLPTFDIFNPWTGQGVGSSITMEQLFSQTSGLPRSSPCPIGDAKLGCNITLDQALARLKLSSLIAPPEAEPQYSNLGFSLAGHAMGFVSGGTPWEEAIVSDVLHPLNMTNTFTSYGNISALGMKDFAVGYDWDGPAPQLEDGFESPAGSLYSCAEDLAKFLLMLFAGSSSDSKLQPSSQIDSFLPAERIRWWLKPHVWNDDGVTGWGRPWEITSGFGPDKKTTFYNKDGGISGYLSQIGLVPELQAGYIVFQGSFAQGFDGLVSQLQDAIAGPLAEAVQSSATSEVPELPENVSLLVGDYLLSDLHVSGPKLFHVEIGTANTTGGPIDNVLLLNGWSDPPPILIWQPHHPVPNTYSALLVSDMAVKGPCTNYQQGAPGFARFVVGDDGKINGLSFPGLWYGTVAHRI